MRDRNRNVRNRHKRGEGAPGFGGKENGAEYGLRSEFKTEALRRQSDGAAPPQGRREAEAPGSREE